MSGSVRGAMEQSIVPTRRGVRPPNRAVLVTLGVALTRKSRCHLTPARQTVAAQALHNRNAVRQVEIADGARTHQAPLPDQRLRSHPVVPRSLHARQNQGQNERGSMIKSLIQNSGFLHSIGNYLGLCRPRTTLPARKIGHGRVGLHQFAGARCSKRSTSKTPKSVIFRCGITGNVRKAT